MPEHELFEYLPTQAIADFLATEAAPPLDGIIFPSVQVAGDALNIALFHKSARVEEFELPLGTEIDASLHEMYEDGEQRDYTVMEIVPPTEDADNASEKKASRSIEFDGNWNPDGRWVTLKIDLDSIIVHVVEAVSYKTADHRVRRHRWEKRGLDSI